MADEHTPNQDPVEGSRDAIDDPAVRQRDEDTARQHPDDPEARETAGVHAGDPLRGEDAVAATPPHGDALTDSDE